MAKRKKSKTSRKKYARKKSDLMGLPQNNNQASTGQKVLKGVAYLATAIIAGGTLGAYAGKASGTVGAVLVGASPFVPEKYVPYMIATGAGMIVASPKKSETAAPAPATPTSGIGALDSAKAFHEEGVSRVKNFLSDLSSKVGLQKQTDKVLGLGDVNYYDSDSLFNTPEYARMLAASQDQMSGLDPILSGMGSTNPLLAGVSDSILN